MIGNEGIINKILADAEEAVQTTTQEAERRVAAILADAEAKCRSIDEDTAAKISAQRAEISRRKQTVADLDVKKATLAARKALIDKTFESAEAALRKLSADKYKSVVSAMLTSYAEDGDVVQICSADAKIITAEFVAACAKTLGIKLSLAKEYGDFEGGIVLQSKVSDKNLTFAVEIKNLRDELETQVAHILFKDN